MFTALKKLDQTDNKKVNNAYQKMAKLIAALEKKEVPEAVVDEVNVKIANLNAFSGSEKEFARALDRAYNDLLRLVQEVCNWVPQDYHRNQWMALGISVFGIPLGIALGLALDNMAFMAAFLPLGMAMGMGVGSSMDKKAAEEGRVLDM